MFRILENKKAICSTAFDLLNLLLPMLLFSQAIVTFQKLQVIFLKNISHISKILIGLSPFHLFTGSEEHPWAYGWEKQLKKSSRSGMQKGREKYTCTSVTTAHSQMPQHSHLLDKYKLKPCSYTCIVVELYKKRCLP